MVIDVSFTNIHMDQETVNDVADVLHSGRYVKGPVVEKFESEFATASGVDYAVGVSNGTAALLLAMKAVGIEPGDEVFAPAHTYFATVSPVLELDATPRFVDIDSNRYTMDPTQLREAIRASEDPAAIVVTHMHGQPAKMDPIMNIAAEYELPVIEDAAQAHLAEYSGQVVGGIGDVGCFSFYPTKNMTVGGDGGMITTDDPAIADKVRALRNHGRDEEGKHVVLGLNYRLNEIKAAVGRNQLDMLPDWSNGRQQAASIYHKRLADIDWLVTPATYENAEHVYHHYPVQVPADKRTAFRAHLDDHCVDTGIHYDQAVHEQPAIRDRVGTVERPVAEEYCRRTVSLPMHPRLSTEEIDHVVDAIRSFEVDA